MAIQLATIERGAKLYAGKGVAPTFTGKIRTNAEKDIDVYIKALPTKQLVNELIVSSIASASKLPVPRAFLAAGVSADFDSDISMAPSYGSGGQKLFFASAVVGKPAIMTFYNGNLADIVAGIDGNDWFGKALCLDEWIANVDRHAKNLMLDSSGWVLIDHDRSLTGPNWIPTDFDPKKSYPAHVFIDLCIQKLSIQERQNISNIATQLLGDIGSINVGQAFSESLARSIEPSLSGDIDSAEQFVVQRIQEISKLVKARLKLPPAPITLAAPQANVNP